MLNNIWDIPMCDKLV